MPDTYKLIEAFGEDDMTDDELREFCVGNSHMWIVTDLTPTTGICACGRHVLEVDSEWVHDLGDGRTTGSACPPYDCTVCGRRHNEPVTYTLTGLDAHGRRMTRRVGKKVLDKAARIAIRAGWTDMAVVDSTGRDVTFDVPAFCE